MIDSYTEKSDGFWRFLRSWISLFAYRRTIGYIQFLIEYAHPASSVLPSIIENVMRFNRIGFVNPSSLGWIRLSKCNKYRGMQTLLHWCLAYEDYCVRDNDHNGYFFFFFYLIFFLLYCKANGEIFIDSTALGLKFKKENFIFSQTKDSAKMKKKTS
jgi:hypothetical protein